jgi:DNA polymerase III epsilon subunit-like protein
MKAVIFDTETTSLLAASAASLKNQPHIIEIFCQKLEHHPATDGWLEKWVEIDELDLMVKPPIPISDKVQEITKITPEMVKDCPPINVVMPTIVRFIEDADYLVAHNLTYDMAVVGYEAERLGLTIKWPKNKVCTVEASEPLFGKRMSLSNLYEEFFSERFPEAHRARNDVRATVRVFRHLWETGEI